MEYPKNYLEAIGVDPAWDSLSGVEKYLNSGNSDIKALFLDYYKNSLSLEDLLVKYPGIMKNVVKGGVSIDTLARTNFEKDSSKEKNYVYGYAQAENQLALSRSNKENLELKYEIQTSHQRICDLEKCLEESQKKVAQLERSLRLARAERDMCTSNGYHITQEVFDKKIKDMDMDARGKNIFTRKLRIYTVGEALEYIGGDYDKLLRVSTAGPKTVYLIKEAFERMLRKGA